VGWSESSRAPLARTANGGRGRVAAAGRRARRVRVLSSAVGSPSLSASTLACRAKHIHGGPSQIMAKRARGSTTRPGQRPRLQRSAARPATATTPAAAPAPKPATLTAEEEARAAELEAAIVAEERQAESTARRTRGRATQETAPRPASTLTISAAEEYAYVARDIRDIARIAVIMLVILFGLFFLIDVTKVIPIGG